MAGGRRACAVAAAALLVALTDGAPASPVPSPPAPAPALLCAHEKEAQKRSTRPAICMRTYLSTYRRRS
jgi:hypothetical protein